MAAARERLAVAFEFFTKLGIPYYCFHDRDVAPEGATLSESHKNLDTIVKKLGEEAVEELGLAWREFPRARGVGADLLAAAGGGGGGAEGPPAIPTAIPTAAPTRAVPPPTPALRAPPVVLTAPPRMLSSAPGGSEVVGAQRGLKRVACHLLEDQGQTLASVDDSPNDVICQRRALRDRV